MCLATPAWADPATRTPAPAFDREPYKQRNVVERAINKLRQHGAVATRSSYVKN